jgi:LssY C-terminus
LSKQSNTAIGGSCAPQTPRRRAAERRRIALRRGAAILATAVLALASAGCTSTDRRPVETLAYKSRLMSAEEGRIRVSVAVLSAEEGRIVYGAPLSRKGMQAVWIEVENHEDRAFWLLSLGLDPDVFSASEAAEAFAREDAELTQRFRRLAFPSPARPGATTSGFVLTNLDEGAKLVQIDLAAAGASRSFSFLAPVPGLRADYQRSQVFLRETYPAEQLVDYYDDEALRAALESLPCCVTNKSGSKHGDPLNLVVVGGLEDAFPALVRRGWRPTEVTWFRSVSKIATSALRGDRYPYAPISNLYLFGRRQDLALQKARDTVHQRNHLRLWLSPMRRQGRPVWVGQISRDIGSRFTIHSRTLTTHKIDPDVDEARTALLEDTAYSQSLAKFGFVKGVGAAPENAPRQNLTTDPYYTDGFRAVLVFEERPRALTEIEVLPWEQRLGVESGQAAADARR